MAVGKKKTNCLLKKTNKNKRMTKNLLELLKTNWKEYLLSAVLSFGAGFAITFLIEIDSLSLKSLTDGSLVGLLFLSVRTGIKFVLQVFVLWYQNVKK